MIGLFQTDGNLYKKMKNKSGKFQLELSIKDSDIIYKIKKYIPYNYKIKKRTRIITIKNRKYISKTIILTIYNINFRNFLNESGIPYGKKSEKIKPPLNLKNLSIKDYIRGLYDGDGSLGLDSKGLPFISFTTYSEYMKDFLVSYISEITNKPKKTVNRNKRDNIYNIKISKEDSQIMVNELYYEDCLSIDRKYISSKDVLNWIRPINMKKINRKNWNKIEDTYILNNSINESIKYLNRSEKSIKMRLFRLNH